MVDLAAVALPVGVGDKAEAVLKARSGRHGAQPLRVERQEALQPLQEIHEDHADHAEQQHRHGIDLPVHLFSRVHPGQAVDQPLDWTQDRVQEGALALKNPGHIAPERFHQQQQDNKVEDNLKPAI